MILTAPVPDDFIPPDCYWRAALHVLAGALPHDARVWSHIDFHNRSIHFDRMVGDGSFSGGEKIFIECAAALFNSEYSFPLLDACSRLDETRWGLVMEGISILRSGFDGSR